MVITAWPLVWAILGLLENQFPWTFKRKKKKKKRRVFAQPQSIFPPRYLLFTITALPYAHKVLDIPPSSRWSLIPSPWWGVGLTHSLVVNRECEVNYSEKPDRYHLNQVIEVNITNNNSGWRHVSTDVIQQERHIISVLFSPKNPNPHPIMRRCQKNPRWGTFCKIPDRYSSKVSSPDKTEKLSQIRGGGGDKCNVLYWAGREKKDMGEKSMKSVVYQC